MNVSDQIIEIGRLIERAERVTEPAVDIFEGAFWVLKPHYADIRPLRQFLDAGAFLDAADSLLPKPGIWRRYTDQSASVYAASPYNAKEQKRYDGRNAECFPCALVAAILRMTLEPLLKVNRAMAGIGEG